MAGKRGFRAYPKHLPRPTAKGNMTCQASGFIRPAGTLVTDVRQGQTVKEFADVTPGFGTRHPQDQIHLGALSDPSPIFKARPDDKQNLSKADLSMSDQEIEASIREGRPPRVGH